MGTDAPTHRDLTALETRLRSELDREVGSLRDRVRALENLVIKTEDLQRAVAAGVKQALPPPPSIPPPSDPVRPPTGEQGLPSNRGGVLESAVGGIWSWATSNPREAFVGGALLYLVLQSRWGEAVKVLGWLADQGSP